MVRKQFIALAAFATLAAAGTAARADDITIVDESFMSSKTRAEVCDEVLQARAAGVVFTSEVDLASTMPAKKASVVSRDQVRAEVGEASRRFVMLWYPA
ncbi:MAG: DUF4148 domain-containing protein [Burkholderiales bacterium]|nr:DUF4148 domain-containing protein [Burkholderiales bacterium]